MSAGMGVAIPWGCAARGDTARGEGHRNLRRLRRAHLEASLQGSWSVQNAIDYLVSEAGRQFDPQLVDLFVRSIDRIEKIRETYQDLPDAAPC